MRPLAAALLVVFMVSATSCLAVETHQKTLVAEMDHGILHQRKLDEAGGDSTVRNHHYIPRQDFKGGGSGTTVDASLLNHHYLPRQDFNNGGSDDVDSSNDVNP